MNAFIEVARYLNVLFLSALALVLFMQWRTRRDRPSLWAWLTLAVLALGFLARRVLPDDPQAPLLQLADKLTIALLLLFPYLLYTSMNDHDQNQQVRGCRENPLKGSRSHAEFQTMSPRPNDGRSIGPDR